MTSTSQIAPMMGLGAPLTKRHAGVGVLSAGIAVNGCGLAALGLGIIFNGLVGGVARNPALKEDLMVYAMIGVGMVEFFAIVILLFFRYVALYGMSGNMKLPWKALYSLFLVPS